MTPNLGKEWQQFAKSIPPFVAPNTISEYRIKKQENDLKVQGLLKDPRFDILVKEVSLANIRITLPEIVNHEFNVRIYRPNRPTSDALPVMLYFHGGYWVAGDANSEDFGNRAIIGRGVDIVVVSFEYRRVPEVQWHSLFSDAEYAMKWVSANATSLGADTGKGFLIGGAEARAHLAAICAIRARDKYPNIKLTGQNLIVPTTMAWPDSHIPSAWLSKLTSHAENASAPLLNEAMYEMFVTALGVPSDEARKGENFPVWASLEGLPPAYLLMDECDPIRDQGFLYAYLLHEAGVHTRTDYYLGQPNMFVQYPELLTTLIAGDELTAGIRWLLQERK